MDAIAPTKERIRQSKGGMERPSRSQTTDRPYHRDGGVVAKLHADGDISDDQLQAYVKFSAELERSTLRTAVIGGYGQRVPGTDHSERCRETERMIAEQHVAKALDAVGHPMMCTILPLCHEPDQTLQGICDTLGMSRTRGIGKVSAYIQAATFRLWQHYKEQRVL